MFELGHHRRYHRSRGSRSGIRSHNQRLTIHDVSRRTHLGAHPTRTARRLGHRRARARRRGRHRPRADGSRARGDPAGRRQGDRRDARGGAATHVSVDGYAGASRRGSSPAGVGRQGREHARRVPARRPPERRRGVRGTRGGRHHAIHGAVSMRGREAGRSRAERAHHGPEGLDPVRPAFRDRLLGWSARCGQRGRALGTHQLRRELRGQRVLARRRTLHAAQPVREHRQAAREVGEGHGGGRAPAPAVPVRRDGADRR